MGDAAKRGAVVTWAEIYGALKRLEDAGWEPEGWRGFGATKGDQEIWIRVKRRVEVEG